MDKGGGIHMDTRRQILRAAEALFARQGYDSTTVEQIARQAGVTKGAVYYFFKNKAELFCLVIDQGIDYIREQCNMLLRSDESSDSLAGRIISFYTDISYENVSLFLILFGSRSSDPAVRAMFEQRVGRLIAILSDLVQAGMKDGLFRPADPELLARMFAGMLYSLLSMPVPPDRKRAREAIRALLEQGMYLCGKEKSDDPARA